MYKPRVYKRQFTVVFSLTTSSFKVSLFSSANSWLANKLSCDSSCEFMLKTEKNNGLVDRVQVDGLSGHSHSGSVPLWQNAVARSGEEAEETCAVDSWQLSGVNEPRPDVEVVLPEWIRWRSSWSSALCFLTRSSSLQRLKRDKEIQRSGCQGTLVFNAGRRLMILHLFYNLIGLCCTGVYYDWPKLFLVPVRCLTRPSRSMHFGDVSETNPGARTTWLETHRPRGNDP